MWFDKIPYFPADEGSQDVTGAKVTSEFKGSEFIASEFYVEYHLLPEVIEELFAKRDLWGADKVMFSEFRPLE